MLSPGVEQIQQLCHQLVLDLHNYSAFMIDYHTGMKPLRVMRTLASAQL